MRHTREPAASAPPPPHIGEASDPSWAFSKSGSGAPGTASKKCQVERSLTSTRVITDLVPDEPGRRNDPPPDCRGIVIHLQSGVKSRSPRRTTSQVKVPGKRTRESALDTAPPVNNRRSQSDGGRGGAAGRRSDGLGLRITGAGVPEMSPNCHQQPTSATSSNL